MVPDLKNNFSGTLSIDLGNTNTVIAFQDENDIDTTLIEIPSITSSPGIVPSVIWVDEVSKITKIGVSAFEMKNKRNTDTPFHSNFKRLIGNPFEKNHNKVLSPKKCGEKFFKILLENIPREFEIKRLVLTAPIDTYKGYREWLISLCEKLRIDEVALVDEPTAASLGIKIPFGSKILTIDIGGSTIDMTIIKIEGGEGKSAPIAELLKFRGKELSAISKQKIRCAEIISKVGSKIGGKDIDQWIVDYFLTSNQDIKNLLRAEAIKCRLSHPEVDREKRYPLKFFVNEIEEKEFYLSKEIFEAILSKNNLVNHLNSLLKNLLNEARGNFCNIDDLNAIILVGGGTQIPLIKEWIRNKLPQIPLKTPPPIESIAIGALEMTPGVKIKDILNKGISIRLFDRKARKHFWHPIFFKGQTWPTENPLKLILQASKSGQNTFEIIIGETIEEREYDIIFENGLPKLSEFQREEEVIKWDKNPLRITLKNNYQFGEDSLKLFFRITKNADLYINCFDIEGKNLGEFNFGKIY